jgi:hypothetical protein
MPNEFDWFTSNLPQSAWHEVPLSSLASNDLFPTKRVDCLPRPDVPHLQRNLHYSKTAWEQDRHNRSQFIVLSPVRRESLEIFINICQAKPTSFDKSQILDLLSLSEEWSVDSLKAHLLSLIENDDDQILTSLRYAIGKGFATDEYETRVAASPNLSIKMNFSTFQFQF